MSFISSKEITIIWGDNNNMSFIPSKEIKIIWVLYQVRRYK